MTDSTHAIISIKGRIATQQRILKPKCSHNRNRSRNNTPHRYIFSIRKLGFQKSLATFDFDLNHISLTSLHYRDQLVLNRVRIEGGALNHVHFRDSASKSDLFDLLLLNHLSNPPPLIISVKSTTNWITSLRFTTT